MKTISVLGATEHRLPVDPLARDADGAGAKCFACLRLEEVEARGVERKTELRAHARFRRLRNLGGEEGAPVDGEQNRALLLVGRGAYRLYVDRRRVDREDHVCLGAEVFDHCGLDFDRRQGGVGLTAVVGEVTSPSMGMNPYEVAADGTPVVPVGAGGVC